MGEQRKCLPCGDTQETQPPTWEPQKRVRPCVCSSPGWRELGLPAGETSSGGRGDAFAASARVLGWEPLTAELLSGAEGQKQCLDVLVSRDRRLLRGFRPRSSRSPQMPQARKGSSNEAGVKA